MPIAHCRCKSSYQDARYGKGMRLHNECKGKISNEIRCTVCGWKHTAAQARQEARADAPVAKSASAKKRRSAKQVRALSKKH